MHSKLSAMIQFYRKKCPQIVKQEDNTIISSAHVEVELENHLQKCDCVPWFILIGHRALKLILKPTSIKMLPIHVECHKAGWHNSNIKYNDLNISCCQPTVWSSLSPLYPWAVNCTLSTIEALSSVFGSLSFWCTATWIFLASLLLQRKKKQKLPGFLKYKNDWCSST